VAIAKFSRAHRLLVKRPTEDRRFTGRRLRVQRCGHGRVVHTVWMTGCGCTEYLTLSLTVNCDQPVHPVVPTDCTRAARARPGLRHALLGEGWW
jgi:hypothetical protein